MRKNFIIVLGLALVLASCGQTVSNEVKVVAHRGYHAAENSIGSLNAAQVINAFGSELDVWMTADDTLVVHHDPYTHNRWSNKYFEIPSSLYSDVRSCTLSNGENVPTLREYFVQACKNKGTKLIIEVKDHNYAGKDTLHTRGYQVLDAILAMVHEFNLQDNVEYISFNLPYCKKIAELEQGAKVQYLTWNTPAETPAQLHEAGITGLDYGSNFILEHPELVEEAHSLGMTVNVWTVDNEDQMRQCIAAGVDFITTDRPERLQEILKESK